MSSISRINWLRVAIVCMFFVDGRMLYYRFTDGSVTPATSMTLSETPRRLTVLEQRRLESELRAGFRP